jgi:hypothetical protein
MMKVSICTCTYLFALLYITPVNADSRNDIFSDVTKISIVANIYIDGSMKNTTSKCQLSQKNIERSGVEILKKAGLDSIGWVDSFEIIQNDMKKFKEAIRKRNDPEAPSSSQKFQKEMEDIQRETEHYNHVPVLSVHIGISDVGDGACLIGVFTDFRAYNNNYNLNTLNYNNKHVMAPLILWNAPPISFMTQADNAENSVASTLGKQLSLFVSNLAQERSNQ